MLKNRILWLFLTTFFCLNVFGQQKDTTQSEFSEAKSQALKKAEGYNRRVIYKREYLKSSDGNFRITFSEISETILPDKTRNLTIQTTDGVIEKSEEIKIGFFLYERINDGKWTKTDLRKVVYGHSLCGNRIIKSDAKITNKYNVAEEFLNGQQTMFYEGLTTVEYSNSYATFSQSKFWINKDSLILRNETTIGRLNPERIEEQTLTEYEYNPKDLKIEAPIK